MKELCLNNNMEIIGAIKPSENLPCIIQNITKLLSCSVVIDITIAEVFMIFFLSSSSLEIKGLLSLLLTFINEHFVIVTLFHSEFNNKLSFGKGSLGFYYIVVITARAELIGVLELTNILSKGLLALLTEQNQIGSLFKLMVHLLFMAVGTIEPFSAARSTDRNLGVKNVFAHNYY